MMNEKFSDEEKRNISEKLNVAEKHIRQSIEDDTEDIHELQSEWQERDSPAERNLRAVEWDQYSSLQQELSEIIAAKKRLKGDVYGICEDCDERITAKRLEALPTARKCTPCQELAEKSSPEYRPRPTL